MNAEDRLQIGHSELLEPHDIDEAFRHMQAADRVISIIRPPQGVVSYVDVVEADHVIYECSCTPGEPFDVTPYGENVTEVEEEPGKITMKACCPNCDSHLTAADVVMRSKLLPPERAMEAFDGLINVGPSHGLRV